MDKEKTKVDPNNLIMSNTPNIADIFHQVMLNIITKGYEKKSKSSIILQNSDTKQKENINALRTALDVWGNESSQWPQPAYNQGEPTKAYKGALMSSIKDTLVAFSETLENSAIFSEQEKQEKNGKYQNIMNVLKIPEDSQKIEPNDLNKEGLFYRDMEHNDRYWDVSGAHIQLMQNLSEILVSITEISISEDLKEKKEDIKIALSTIFTEDLHPYGVCPGGHNNNIKEAKDTLATSPEELLLANWNGYINGLIQEDVYIAPDINSSIINALPIGEQVHLPPAVDYLSGVEKDIVNQKDSHMLKVLMV
jgi:hypothetical protein